MKSTLMEGINKIIESNDINTLEFIHHLESLLKKTISAISEELEMKPLSKQRKITIGNLPEEFGVSYSTKRTDDEICIGQWIFESRKTTMMQHLVFLIVKESFMHFMKIPLTEVIETFVNFIVVLWIQKYFGIDYIENPLIVTINRSIYPEIIAGRDYNFYAYLLELLFKKNLDYVIVFNKINEILNQNSQDSHVIQQFSTWVYRSTIKDEDVIAPIYVKKHQLPLINYYVTKGYENSNTTDLANLLNKHESSILKAVRRISSNYFFFWNAKINYDKIKLHNYFLIIKLGENKGITQLQKKILEIPYLRSLYLGSSEKNRILYSPSLICPHIIADNLREQLIRFERKNLIKDFTLQLFSEKFIYSTITSSKNHLITEPTVKTFKKLLFEKDLTPYKLKKYVLSHEIRDISPTINDIEVADYNLLYFLAYLKQKYLLSGSYGGWIHELPKLLEKNDVPITNMNKVVYFLSQLEIRAKRRGFLSFYLFIRSITNRSPDVLITEAPLIDNPKLINRLRVFGFLGQFQLHDRTIINLPGISHKHPVKDIIKDVLEEKGVKANFYTINLLRSKFVPLHDLFDYDEQKWHI